MCRNPFDEQLSPHYEWFPLVQSHFLCFLVLGQKCLDFFRNVAKVLGRNSKPQNCTKKNPGFKTEFTCTVPEQCRTEPYIQYCIVNRVAMCSQHWLRHLLAELHSFKHKTHKAHKTEPRNKKWATILALRRHLSRFVLLLALAFAFSRAGLRFLCHATCFLCALQLQFFVFFSAPLSSVQKLAPLEPHQNLLSISQNDAVQNHAYSTVL